MVLPCRAKTLVFAAGVEPLIVRPFLPNSTPGLQDPIWNQERSVQ